VQQQEEEGTKITSKQGLGAGQAHDHGFSKDDTLQDQRLWVCRWMAGGRTREAPGSEQKTKELYTHEYLLFCQRCASAQYHVTRRKLGASHLPPQSKRLFSDHHGRLSLLYSWLETG